MSTTPHFDPFVELAGRFVSMMREACSIGIAPSIPDDEIDDEILVCADYLREGNSIIWRTTCDGGCKALARSYVKHGQVASIRYHHPDCESQPGCGCGCYQSIADQLDRKPINIMDGTPDEPALMNRAQRRAAKRRGCRR